MCCADEAPVSACTLTFKHAVLEQEYQKHHNARARLHDQQGAAVYFAMVSSGSLLYVLMLFFVPSRAGIASDCTSLIAFSWLGPLLHLAVLALLPDAAYSQHRTRITLALRLLYLYGTSVRGYSQCGVGLRRVGRVSQHEVHGTPLESIFSALAWRSGLIGLLWYAGAFPLLFWQHMLVQSVFLAAYWAALSPAVCADVARIQHSHTVLSFTARTARTLWAQLLAAAAAPGSAAHIMAAASATAAQAVPAVGPAAGGLFDPGVSCLRELRWFQFAVGHALPSFVLYCVEHRARMSWWRHKKHQQQQQPGQANYSSSGSYCTLCDSACNEHRASTDGKASPVAAGDSSTTEAQQQRGVAAAAVAAAAAGQARPGGRPTASDAGGDQQQQQQQHKVCTCDASGGFCPDQFVLESQEAHLAPTSREVYVLLVALAMVWLGLGAAT